MIEKLAVVTITVSAVVLAAFVGIAIFALATDAPSPSPEVIHSQFVEYRTNACSPKTGAEHIACVQSARSATP